MDSTDAQPFHRHVTESAHSLHISYVGSHRPQMKNLLRGALAASVLLWHPGSAAAAEARAFQSAAVLSDSLQSMVGQVPQRIVRVEVTGFGPLEQSDATQPDLVISKQRS